MPHSTFQILSRTHGGLSKRILEISWYQNRRERRPYRPYIPSQPSEHPVTTVVTLDPNKFAEKKQQRFCLGGRRSFPYFVEQAGNRVMDRFFYDRRGARRGAPTIQSWPAPPDIKGFLYYTTLPGRPRIGGELRLRVTLSDDPASFASGSDLLRLHGQPWSRPLYSIPKTHASLYQKLREDQLVSDDLDSILSTLPIKRLVYSSERLLYSLNDEFTIDFSSQQRTLSIITEKGMVTGLLRRKFFDARDSRGGPPYTGSATARFERSTLPDHKGTRTVVLRFVKIITPLKCVMPLYDGYIECPKEGELFYRHSRIMKSHPSAWSLDIDKSKGIIIPGLKLLWDA